jgi:cytochrome c
MARIFMLTLIAAAASGIAVPAGLVAQTPAMTQTAAMAKTGTAVAGKLVFMRCMACHSIEKGAANKVGPNLSGVVGRKSGVAAGYKYSTAMAAARLTWNEATLDKWLTRPAGLVPGTSMVFAGLPKPEDRASVIAYLKKPVP